MFLNLSFSISHNNRVETLLTLGNTFQSFFHCYDVEGSFSSLSEMKRGKLHEIAGETLIIVNGK